MVRENVSVREIIIIAAGSWFYNDVFCWDGVKKDVGKYGKCIFNLVSTQDEA